MEGNTRIPAYRCRALIGGGVGAWPAVAPVVIETPVVAETAVETTMAMPEVATAQVETSATDTNEESPATAPLPFDDDKGALN